MMYASLTTAQKASYFSALVSSHKMSTTVYVYDGNENLVEDITEWVIGGQVDVDTSNDVDRSLSLTLFDPNYLLSFDPASPICGGLNAASFLSVLYNVWVIDLNDYVQVPVFFGPVSHLGRNKDRSVTVEGEGKESLLIDPMKYHAALQDAKGNVGTTRKSAVNAVLGACGEPRSVKGDLGGEKLSKFDPTIYGDVTYWAVARIAAGTGFNLYYDGGGTPYGLAKPDTKTGTPVYTFGQGEGGQILDLPQVTWDVTQFRNRVYVNGKDPKKNPLATVLLDPDEPMSPQSLARGGKNRFLSETIEDLTLTTQSAAETSGKTYLNSTLAAKVSFTCLPVPHLQPYDLCEAVVGTSSQKFVLSTFTIPLTSTDSMSIGFTKHVKIKDRVKK